MPFEVFRRHQRKMMAMLAILAMFSFVLADALPNLLRGNGPGGGNDPVIATVYGRDLRRSGLERLLNERRRANGFVSRVMGYPGDLMTFGGYSAADLVDAYILEREADKLDLPVSADVANKFLLRVAGPLTNANKLEQVYRGSRYVEEVTAEQLLLDIANQIRLSKVATLTRAIEATPLDVFDSYRDQNERVSAYAVAFPVEDDTSKVGEPSADEEQALFEKYKNALPDPDSPTPGFKVPQKVRFEVITADVEALAAKIRPKLTDAELRQIYEARKAEFFANPPELPTNLFAGSPDLTPHDDFPELRTAVASKVAQERALEEINGKFEGVRNDLITFFERYSDAVTDKAESLPRPGALMKAGAETAGLEYESLPPIARIDSAAFGGLARSRLGTSPSQTAPDFLDLAYSPRSRLFDPLDLADGAGHRYLAWKVEDEPARVPGLAEARKDVVKAWKLIKARPLAEAAARALADAATKAGGGALLKGLAEKREVIETSAQPKLVMSFTMQGYGPPRPAEIYEIPRAGDAIRNAIFHLEPKTAAVAPNLPETTYYALTLHDRETANMEDLYKFAASKNWLDRVNQEIESKRLRERLASLRTQAGLPANWAPPNESRRDAPPESDAE